MQFISDNAAPVHPAVWQAMKAVDATDMPYDGDAMSTALDGRFSELFDTECAVLWTPTGTAANCLALASMVPPFGGIVCHREAHIEVDEGGAPGFFTHGAKLMLADGPGAKLTPEAAAAVMDPIRNDVHQVQAHAIAVTQASEYGECYTPDELSALGEFARDRNISFHMDGARFANAVAHLGCSAAEASSAHGINSLAFGFIKNGGMSAEALVFFDTTLADEARRRRKRAGHLASKGRFLAAQLLAMVDDDVWLANARAANHAAAALARAAPERLMYPVQANEVFMKLSAAEREVLRGYGYRFYDWGNDAGRFVAAWNTPIDDARALAAAIAAL